MRYPRGPVRERRRRLGRRMFPRVHNKGQGPERTVAVDIHAEEANPGAKLFHVQRIHHLLMFLRVDRNRITLPRLQAVVEAAAVRTGAAEVRAAGDANNFMTGYEYHEIA